MANTKLTDYTGKIPPQNADKSKFIAELTALVQPMLDVQAISNLIATDVFDLDLATGVQLDILGEWIGRSRKVLVPISGSYFSFDTIGIGWDQGNWQGPFDATTGVTILDDNIYRLLLRAKIIMNSWDGTAAESVAALNQIFGLSSGTFVTLQDNQDMTMTIGVSGVVPPATTIALLQNGEFTVKPVGVGIRYDITSVNAVPLFGFDLNTSSIGGWDVGAWAGQPGLVPGQVSGFTLASKTANSATFAWTAPLIGSGISYQLQYRTIGALTFTNAPITNNTSITVGNLASGQDYQAQVYAVNTSGPGSPSSVITFTTSAGAPAQVTGLAQSATGTTTTSIGLTWNTVGGADSYQVQYRVNGQSAFSNWPAVSTTSATVSGLALGSIYDFQVYAININGSGPASTLLTLGTANSAPGLVTNLATTLIDIDRISIAWNNPTTGNGPFAFRIEYAQNTVPLVYQAFTGVIALSATGGSADITGLAGGVTYLIRVAASNGGGSGNFTAPISATTQIGPPNQVSGLSSSSVSATSVTLAWLAVVNAVSYQIQYQPDGSTTWINGPLVLAPTLTGTVTGLSAGVTYNFRVYAIGP